MERPLDEQSLRRVNLRTLEQRFYTDAASRAAVMIESRSEKQLQEALDSHLVRTPSAAGAKEREDLDALLKYYSVIELASMVGAVPATLPDAVSARARLHLESRFVKTYYEEYYPLLLPRLLVNRLDGRPVPSDLDDANNADLLMQFIDISSIGETPAARVFLRLLDDNAAAASGRSKNLSEVLATLRTRGRLARYLATPSERQTPVQQALDGLSDVTRFARALNRYLATMSGHAVWQSACWHYHGGWFQQLGGRVVGAITAAIELFRQHVPDSAEEVRGDLRALEATMGASATDEAESVTEAISATHGSMDETIQSLQLLTSGIYRAALDAYTLTGQLPRASEAPRPEPVEEASTRRRTTRVARPVHTGRSSGVAALALEILEPAKAIGAERVYAALEDALAAAARKYYKTREPLEVLFDRSNGGVQILAVKEVVGDESEVEDPQAQWTLEQARTVDPDVRAGGTIQVSYITKEVVDDVRDPQAQIRTSEAQNIDPNIRPGDAVRIPLTIPPDELVRIAAQSAKQVIYQKVREAEREKVYAEFKDRIGELENSYVKRFERGDMIIDLAGTTEGIIPRSQQSRADRYSQGDRIKAVIIDVQTQPKGWQVVLSRTDPRLLIRLFEMEVPEIYDGTVVIKGAVREPGERAKIAVASQERDVDPVAACVGMNGSRVQSISRELNGEKIDIVPWHEDIVAYAQNALAPARIARVAVTTDAATHRPHLDIIVYKDQLAPAIGKRGLNVRLAAELLGAKIDIKSEEEVKSEVADALEAMLQEAMAESGLQTSVRDVENMPDDWAQMLEEAGYDDLDSLLNASVEDLTAINGVDKDMAAEILHLAMHHETLEEEQLEEEEADDFAEATDDDLEEEEIENEVS